MEPILVALTGAGLALGGGVIRDLSNRFIPNRNEVLLKKEKKKRIEIIKSKLPDDLWTIDEEPIFSDDIVPINLTTRRIQERFFEDENLNIDEVYNLLIDLKKKNLMEIVMDSKHKKTVVWRSTKCVTVGGSAEVDSIGAIVYKEENLLFKRNK